MIFILHCFTIKCDTFPHTIPVFTFDILTPYSFPHVIRYIVSIHISFDTLFVSTCDSIHHLFLACPFTHRLFPHVILCIIPVFTCDFLPRIRFSCKMFRYCLLLSFFRCDFIMRICAFHLWSPCSGYAMCLLIHMQFLTLKFSITCLYGIHAITSKTIITCEMYAIVTHLQDNKEWFVCPLDTSEWTHLENS